MENLQPLFAKANKILSELESLEKVAKGKIFEKTRKNLISSLNQVGDRIISSSQEKATSKKERRETSKNKRPKQTKKLADGLIDQKSLKELKKKAKIREKKLKKKIRADAIEIRKPNFYVQFANSLFSDFSNRLIQQKHFKDLALSIRKSGLNILVHSYISMIFLNVVLALIAGIIFGVFFSFFSVKIVFAPIPISITLIKTTFFIFLRNLIVWPLLLTSVTLLVSYYWPMMESNSRRSKINDNLPFGIIHMSAIAGSGVEPTKIFKLLSETKEYGDFSNEARRVVNKINLYGYDLTTALKESAKLSPSPKVKDLFNGMATVLSTGGDLKLYLEKKAADSMLEYKLNRKKFAEASGTYADVYTGVLITAPLIFGVMIAVMAPLGGNLLGISFQTISVIGLVAIVFLNIIFLIFMKVIQPSD